MSTTPSKHSEFTSSDSEQFSYRKWLPDSQVNRIIIGTHGICGAADDFVDLAEFLLKRSDNIGIYVYNTRSQGHDPVMKRRGDINNPELWYQDLISFTHYVKRKHPNAEIIWYGESMGSIITLNTYAHHREHDIPLPCDRLILSAPVISLKQRLAWWQRFGLHFGKHLCPKCRIPLDRLSGGQSFEITQGYHHTDEETQTEDYYVKSFTLRFLYHFGQEIEKMSLCAKSVEHPVAIIHGGNDFFTSESQIKAFASAFPNSTQTTLFHYPDAYHLILYDKMSEKIFTDLLNWVNK